MDSVDTLPDGSHRRLGLAMVSSISSLCAEFDSTVPAARRLPVVRRAAVGKSCRIRQEFFLARFSRLCLCGIVWPVGNETWPHDARTGFATESGCTTVCDPTDTSRLSFQLKYTWGLVCRLAPKDHPMRRCCHQPDARLRSIRSHHGTPVAAVDVAGNGPVVGIC